MTAPVEHGYPDFGRYAATADKFLIDNNTAPVAGLNNLVAVFVGDQKYLGVFAIVTGTSISVRFNFFGDSAGSQLFSGRTIDLQDGAWFEGSIPVLGPWLIVEIFAVGNAASLLLQAWGQPSHAMQTSSSARANVVFSEQGRVVAPGTNNLDSGRVWTGEAILYAALPGVLSAVHLFSIEYTGTLIFLTRIQGTGIEAERRIFLPGQQLRIRFTNTSGVNQLFDYSLTAASMGE